MPENILIHAEADELTMVAVMSAIAAGLQLTGMVPRKVCMRQVSDDHWTSQVIPRHPPPRVNLN